MLTAASRNPRRPGGAALLVPALVLALVVGPGTPSAHPLTAVDELAAAYDLILDTRFEEVDAALEAACGAARAPALDPTLPPRAPDEACLVLRATATWWRIQLDPHSRALDDRFVEEADAAIEATERWTERAPDSAEAWFYLGGAYAARVSWKVSRDERLSAARDGKRIKEAMERALTLDPSLVDARFGIGLYKYYAAVAPAALRFLRFLLLLPGGDREEGLRDMEATHRRGSLLAGEADYQLHWLYLWYEDQPERALALLEDLRARYPSNALFVQRIAEVRAAYFHDPAGSLSDWRRLAERAGSYGTPQIAEVSGRLGMAEQLDALAETDLAVAQYRRVLKAEPTRPYGVTARAWLGLGRAFDRLGNRTRAEAAYRTAMTVRPDPDPFDIARHAREGLARPPDAQAARAYRQALAGWRAFQRGELALAKRRLDGAVALAPDDAVTRVRAARVTERLGRTADALAEYERIAARGGEVSPLALAPALLWSGEILEAQGERARAADRYRAAAGVFAADSRVTRQAADALARLEHGN